jgi:hypothetical protein
MGLEHLQQPSVCNPAKIFLTFKFNIKMMKLWQTSKNKAPSKREKEGQRERTKPKVGHPGAFVLSLFLFPFYWALCFFYVSHSFIIFKRWLYIKKI